MNSFLQFILRTFYYNFWKNLRKALYYFCSGCSPRRRGWDLHQTQPEDWWVHPAGRLWVEHGWVGWSSLWLPHGPHQLPALHLPGLHTPTSKSTSLPRHYQCCCIIVLYCCVFFWMLSVFDFVFFPLTFTLSCFIWLQSCLYSVFLHDVNHIPANWT